MEQVLVFDTGLMNNFKGLPGISIEPDDIGTLLYTCMPEAKYVDRPKAEEDEELKQVIPYVIVTRKNKVLAYMRSKKSGDVRLQEKWSIGVGGHINPEDQSTFSTVHTVCKAVGRELEEEMDWGPLTDATVNNIEPYGVIYDDKDAVGRVHIGYVLRIDLDSNNMEYPKACEETIARMDWFTVEEALKLRNLEGWSKLVLDSMAK